METWAVITTRDRHELLINLLGDLDVPPDRTILVDNRSVPPVRDFFAERLPGRDYRVIDYPEDPPNISRMWNLGLREARRLATGDAAIAVLNDDLRLPPNFVGALAAGLERHGAAIAFPDVFNRGNDLVLRIAEPIDLSLRMTGFAFAVRADARCSLTDGPLEADETIVWWYGDDDLDWRGRLAGGTARVGGLGLEHLYPNSSTNADPRKLEQTGRDRETFLTKWGKPPW